MNPSNFDSEANATSCLTPFFASYSKLNYIPTNKEIADFKSFIDRGGERLRQMEDKINCLHRELKYLESEHRELERQLADCRALVSLPRRLPDDILREIFHHSLSENCYVELNTLGVPLIFTQVCRRWRELAISTTTLWSTIHIPLVYIEKVVQCDAWNRPIGAQEEYVTQDIHHGRATLTYEWLKRSGRRPIAISLFGGKKPISTPFFDLYLDSLIPSSSCWKSLFLEAPFTSLSRIATIPARDLQFLESLCLRFEDDPAGHRHPKSALWVKSEIFKAPSLRKLSIRQDIFDPTHFRVAWSNLVHLELGGAPDFHPPCTSRYLTMSKASAILKACRHLIYCSIELGSLYDDDTEDSDIEAMHLPVLKQLSIGERIDIRLFVEKLNLPVLQELDFCSTIDAQHHSNCHIILAKSGGTIRKLAIDAQYLNNQLFIESLRQCPNLTSLTVRQTRDGTQIFHDFQVDTDEDDRTFRIDDQFLGLLSTGGDSLCPRLEEFICKVDARFTQTGLVQFIKRKQTAVSTGIIGPAKMKKLSIRSMPDQRDRSDLNLHELSQVLRSYVTDGMAFREDIAGIYHSTYGTGAW